MKHKGEVKMIVQEEIMYVDVVKLIYHILHYTLILKQNIMEKLQKELMQIKFKVEEEEEDQEKTMMIKIRMKMKRII